MGDKDQQFPGDIGSTIRIPSYRKGDNRRLRRETGPAISRYLCQHYLMFGVNRELFEEERDCGGRQGLVI